MNTFLKRVGKNVANARRESELTQAELAERVDISTRYLQSIEAGQVNMTLSTLLRLARPLRVPPARLIAVDNEWVWKRGLAAR